MEDDHSFLFPFTWSIAGSVVSSFGWLVESSRKVTIDQSQSTEFKKYYEYSCNDVQENQHDDLTHENIR